ncbi:MAG: Spy0128 family protein [Oscillospiraceae bacterium]|jgi:pilin isopeptide linkage protein
MDAMNNSGASTTTIDGEYYGWSYVACGIYGTWKEGTSSDVISDIKIYDTNEDSSSGIVAQLRATSSSPEILNGTGSISPSQVDGGESFTISGLIDNANWDWNPIQEPVLYIFMPDGFTYEDLQVTNATLSDPVDLGSFEYDGLNVEVYKYTLDIGEETRGVYQPDFTNKYMSVSMTVNTSKRSRTGTYHINDFLGFSTEDFEDIGAVIKADHWYHSNWNTSKYTDAVNSSSIADEVNYGETMVSLSESTGVAVKQGYEITAKASFSVTNAETGETVDYVYDNSTEETKENTTAKVNKGDTVQLKIDVKNNAETYLDHCTLFVPLMNEGDDFGTGFMPEGANGFNMQLQSVTAPDSFEVQYIKFNSGVSYSVNEVPQASDYEIVTDPSEADMVMLVSTSAIADGYTGTVTLTFIAGNDLTSDDAGAVNVITPMLDYDINGNTSTQTKEAAAVTFTGIDDTVSYTSVSADTPVSKQITNDTPAESSEFVFDLTADSDSSTLPDGMTNMPMPGGTDSVQTVTVSITGAGSTEFGDITFALPGTYVYSVTEENTGIEGYTYDTSTYSLKFVVTADENGVLSYTRTITKDGSSADEVVFTNSYESSSQNVIRTGDSSSPAAYAILMAAAACGIALIMRRKKN